MLVISVVSANRVLGLNAQVVTVFELELAATHSIAVHLNVELEDILHRLGRSCSIIAQICRKVPRLRSDFIRHHRACLHDVSRRLRIKDAGSGSLRRPFPWVSSQVRRTVSALLLSRNCNIAALKFGNVLTLKFGRHGGCLLESTSVILVSHGRLHVS